jgi:SpoVK/Ycf46/Vps4 family AAA+-type ATPase
MKKNEIRLIVYKIFDGINIVCSDYHLSTILKDCLKYKIEINEFENILNKIKKNKGFFDTELKKYDRNLAFFFSIYCYAVYEQKEKNYIDSNKLISVVNNDNNLIYKGDDLYNEETLDNIFFELNSMIGLKNIKSEIQELADLASIRNEKIKFNLPTNNNTLHLVFKGNPGTGKTTVARLIGKIYNSIGLLKSGHLIEVGRHDIVGKYVGHTAKLVEAKFEEARNGVLFIDEAYTLSSYQNTNDYGIEAIQTILKLMEDNRDEIVVIVAGYPNEMDLFLSSNPGLKSRFSNIINFEDYTYFELIEILLNMISADKNVLTSEALHKIKYIFEENFTNQGSTSNARFVRNYYEQVLKNQATRLAKLNNHTYESLSTIIDTDIIEI